MKFVVFIKIKKMKQSLGIKLQLLTYISKTITMIFDNPENLRKISAAPLWSYCNATEILHLYLIL